jgi:HAD superfamily hydrolase (TIGR01549 family)
MTRQVQAVVFDIGETLVDETRHWAAVARYAGVPELTLMGVLGGLIERREHHRSIFAYLQTESVDPNVFGYAIEAQDLYPDVISTLRQLKTEGYLIGVTGNQPAGAIEQVQALGLPIDMGGSSSDWGVSKPDPEFFDRIAAELKLEKDQILYIGDRLDNDVLPAQASGMHTAFIQRGPWGYLQASWPDADQAQHRISNLAGVHAVLDRINAQATSSSPAR